MQYDRGITEEIVIYEQLPTPSIEFTEYEGRVVHEWLNDWYGEYSYEAKDQNGNPVTILTEGGSTFTLPDVGTQIRVKLTEDGYWLESEWSEWYTFEGIKVTAPTLGEYNTSTCKISWSLYNTDNISHYLYTINGGTPVRIELNGTLSVFLNNGDVFSVKCVPTTDAIANGYADSEWMTYTCVDNRTSLATPTNVRYDDEYARLAWDAVDGANYYIIEQTYDGVTEEIVLRNSYYGGIIYGATYRVRALPKDQENDRSSGWSESFTNTSEKG